MHITNYENDGNLLLIKARTKPRLKVVLILGTVLSQRGRYEPVSIETRGKIGIVLGVNIGDIIEFRK